MVVVVVTGCGRGIGLGLCQLLLEQSHTVIGTIRKPVEEYPGLVDIKENPLLTLLQCDVTDSASVVACRDSVTAKGFDHIDILVNNAGVALEDMDVSPMATTVETLSDTFRTNTIAPVVFLQTFLPLLSRAQHPVAAFISSTLGSNTRIREIGLKSGMTAYAMSKAALNMFVTVCAGMEERGKVVILALHPGWVDTDMGNKGGQPPLSIRESVEGLVGVMLGAGEEMNGKFMDYQGKDIPY